MGKGERYFCDTCGVFIKGNPLHGFLLGITIAILSSFLAINQVLVISDNSGKNSSSSYSSLLFLVFLYGVFDGCKAVVMGIRGLTKNRKQQG